jgi:uncharacterized membrane protein
MQIRVIILLLAISVFYGKRDEWNPSMPARALFLIISIGVVLLSMASMFLSHTGVHSHIITGVQGRYFTPVIPLVLLAFRFNKLLIKHVLLKNASVLIMVCIQASLVVFILDYTITMFTL